MDGARSVGASMSAGLTLTPSANGTLTCGGQPCSSSYASSCSFAMAGALSMSLSFQ